MGEGPLDILLKLIANSGTDSYFASEIIYATPGSIGSQALPAEARPTQKILAVSEHLLGPEIRVAVNSYKPIQRV